MQIFPHAIEDPLKVPWKFQFDTCCLGSPLGFNNLEAKTVYPCFVFSILGKYHHWSECLIISCISQVPFPTLKVLTKSNLSLQCLKRVEKSHATFITGLEFLPTSEEADVIRGYSDASVVSISVDHQICVHHVPRLSKFRQTFSLQ